MAITYIASCSGGGTINGVTSGSMNSTGADFIQGVYSNFALVGAATITDNMGNSYAARTAQVSSNTRTQFQDTGNTVPTVGSGHTLSVSSVGGYPSVAGIAYSGVKTSTPLDQQNGAFSNSASSLATGSITPSENNCAVISAVGTGGSTISSVSTGTIRQTVDFLAGNHFGVAIADEVQTTATARNATWTLAGTTDLSAVIISQKSEPAAGNRRRRLLIAA